jgi:hypothetical protein
VKTISTLLFVVAFTAGASAQAPVATSSIRGQVTSAATGRPLIGALVRLQMIGGSREGRTVRTDNQGRYEIVNLPAGRYSFSASREGFLDQNFDQPQPRARYRLLELAAAEQLDGVNFRLHRGGAVIGIITDEFGDPMPGVRVDVLRETFGAFGRQLVAMSHGTPVLTDDQGKFRVHSLLPGTYVVSAVPEGSDHRSSPSYGRTYFPGTLNEADAQTVRVAIGQDAAADFMMIPARMARVAGVIRDSHGRPPEIARASLRSSNRIPSETIGASTIEADGHFSIEGVRPGRYVLQVYSSNALRTQPPPREWAITRVEVSGADIDNLTITTSTGSSVSGRVIFEGTPPPELKELRIVTDSIDPSLRRLPYPGENSTTDSAWHFRLDRVLGRVRLFIGNELPAGWFLKRVLLNGIDVTFSGIDVSSDVAGVDVVVTNQATTVTGTVKDRKGEAVKEYMVAFFPIGKFEGLDLARRQRTIRPDPEGVYRIRNLPPGAYEAVAVPLLSLPYEAEWEPGFRERLQGRLTAFKLTEGESFLLNLQLVE